MQNLFYFTQMIWAMEEHLKHNSINWNFKYIAVSSKKSIRLA